MRYTGRQLQAGCSQSTFVNQRPLKQEPDTAKI